MLNYLNTYVQVDLTHTGEKQNKFNASIINIMIVYHMTALLLNGYRYVLNNDMNTRYIHVTLWAGTCDIITASVTANAFLIEILFALTALKTLLKGHMIKGILHSWSFHIKLSKLAEGSIDKFHMT